MFRSNARGPRLDSNHDASRPQRRPRLRLESLEQRALMATLADIPDVTVPTLIGYQMPLEGGSGNAQTYTVQSSNPDIKATIAQGQFLTFNVTHTSSGANDPAFTGKFTFQLFGDLTPDTVEHISRLVTQGFYDGKLFPRVANGFPTATDFILQGGSTTISDTVNQPGFPFPDEFVQQLAFTGKGLKPTDTTSVYSIAGQLAMANSGSDTNGSQFFVTTADPRSLDFKHTIFAQLVSSDVVNGKIIPILMTEVARTGDTPVSPITITTATLTPTSPDGVVHIDATMAEPGASATLTVTATDSVDHTTATKSFKVDVAPNPIQERVFINGRIQNQVVGLISSTAPIQGQVDEFAIPFVNPNGPTGNVAFKVAGGVSSSGFTNVVNATATVDANGIVKVTPNSGFSGVINLVVGVRNAAAADNVANYDTQTLTLTVNQSDAINLPPVAVQGTDTTITGTPIPVQLVADTGNPDSQQTLVYEIIGPPANGTITNFDNTKGTLTYVPNAGFQGNETIQFRVRDLGAPTPNLSSVTATQTIVVDGGDTGAVRLIGKVLVVTPLPRTDAVPNTINVNLFNNRVQVTVNGRLDSIQPLASDLNRVVVYGATTGDIIQVAPTMMVPTTLDGGHGGVNNITSGGGPTTTHVWFGKNKVTAGPGRDYIVGQAGRFRVLNPADKDLAFAGVPRRMASLHALALKPRGTFFKARNGRLVPVRTPHQVTAAKRELIFTPPPTTPTTTDTTTTPAGD